jgi:hypothetical protein
MAMQVVSLWNTKYQSTLTSLKPWISNEDYVQVKNVLKNVCWMLGSQQASDTGIGWIACWVDSRSIFWLLDIGLSLCRLHGVFRVTNMRLVTSTTKFELSLALAMCFTWNEHASFPASKISSWKAQFSLWGAPVPKPSANTCHIWSELMTQY